VQQRPRAQGLSGLPAAAAGPSPTTALEVFGVDDIVDYRRSPSDVVRLILFSLVTVGLLALTRWAESTVVAFESDVVALFQGLNPSVERALSQTLSVAAGIVGAAVYVPPLLLKRYRLIGYIVVGNLATALLVGAATWWLDQAASRSLLTTVVDRFDATSRGSLNLWTLADLASSFVILAPFVGRRWRQAGMVIIATLAMGRLVLVSGLPAEIFLVLAIGATVGVAVLLAFGRPNRRPNTSAVRDALASSALTHVALEPFALGVRGARWYVATDEEGARFLVKVLSPDERSVDLLYRTYRYLRLKNVGDERPFSSLRRSIEHEALVALQARDVGVGTPRMRAIAQVGDDSMLIAYEMIEGRRVDQMDASEVSDRVLREIWGQLSRLREHRIAHRDLRRANVLVDDSGEPWLTGFAFGEVAANNEQLDGDVAQLLAALTLTVGADRAVTSAVETLGGSTVGAALSRLQPNALSGATRAALKEQPGLLEELQDTVAQRCAVSEPSYVPLERISRQRVFTAAMLVAVSYFLLPQLADLPGVVREVGDATWGWVPLVVLFSALTYVGAALGVGGAVPERLRAVPTLLAQVAASFTSNLAPSGVGGMALNVRYLQKSGVDSPVAASSVGLNAIAGIAVHLGLMVVFFVWAGGSALGSISIPSWSVIAIGVAFVAVSAAGAFAIPATREILLTKVVPVLRRALSGLAAVIRSPGKIALLIGGSVAVTMSYVLAVYFSTVAFGGGLDLAQVGAAYLAGSAIAAVAPTPGGLGALEAAVITGLVGAGMPGTAAVPAVFLFRLATFWLPILPGWLAFNHLRREDFI
jgi:undecaprenyl-diphosphatase